MISRVTGRGAYSGVGGATMDQAKRDQAFKVLFFDVEPLDFNAMPMFAHYTSMDALEKIMKSDEIWFSHPLLMNDHEEVHWGITRGVSEIEGNAMLHFTLKEPDTYSKFID